MKKLATSLLLMASALAMAADRYHVESLVLLQPDQMLRERVCCLDEFANYFKSVNAAADVAVSKFTTQTPTSGFIVVAVRPGGQSKAWTDFSPKLSAPDNAALIAAVEAVKPFKAEKGTVLAGTRVSLWGVQATEQQLPNPDEWRAAFKNSDKPMEVTDMVDRIWPSSSGT